MPWRGGRTRAGGTYVVRVRVAAAAGATLACSRACDKTWWHLPTLRRRLLQRLLLLEARLVLLQWPLDVLRPHQFILGRDQMDTEAIS